MLALNILNLILYLKIYTLLNILLRKNKYYDTIPRNTSNVFYNDPHYWY